MNGITGYGINNLWGFSPLTSVSKDEKDTEQVTGVKPKEECQTCKNRKYVDGSDENVSYKAPTKISPDAAAARVMAHEQEHVSNAFGKAAQAGGKVLQASVSLKVAICPECGRSYVCGGTTTTRIAYPKDNPYSNNKKSYDKNALVGANIDKSV